MSASIELDKLFVKFGDFVAVRQVELKIEAGEFFSFLGPSGCGKTTILRTISGFQNPTSGRILIDGQDVGHLPPNKRPTALIFQNLALFPLMKVWENVAFALEIKGVSARVRRRRAEELLDLVALHNVSERMVSELSGGQKQRVAVARALCAEPKVLLLDEPLSALDLKLRNHMRTELRAIQKRVGITFIYITHDQGEAMTMSDRVAVMSNGQIEQVDRPKIIYEKPASGFVASFVGDNNVIEGSVRESRKGEILISTEFGEMLLPNHNMLDFTIGQAVNIFIRPEHIELADENIQGQNGQILPIQVEHLVFEGSEQKVFCTTSLGRKLKFITHRGYSLDDFSIDQEVKLFAPNERLLVLPKGELA